MQPVHQFVKVKKSKNPVWCKFEFKLKGMNNLIYNGSKQSAVTACMSFKLQSKNKKEKESWHQFIPWQILYRTSLRPKRYSSKWWTQLVRQTGWSTGYACWQVHASKGEDRSSGHDLDRQIMQSPWRTWVTVRLDLNAHSAMIWSTYWPVNSHIALLSKQLKTRTENMDTDCDKQNININHAHY